MDVSSIIPHYQPVPLPGPHWLLKTLLIVGFYIHAIPMNVALTGGFVSGAFLLFGQTNNHTYAKRLGNALAYSLPFFVSFAITFGIVPLLFIQLTYGPLFYTSSILIAVPWLLIIFMLLTGYYAFYIYNYRREILGNRAPWVLMAASVLFLGIAFIFTNNTTLMLMPEKWVALYQHNPYGLNLNLESAQIIPRYLHFVIAAVAVTSLTIGSFGVYWHSRERDYGQWLIKTASIIFLVVTFLQFPIGVWFLLSLPYTVMMNFLGRDTLGTGIFIASLVGDFIALIAMFLATRHGEPKPFLFGLSTTLIVIFLMVMIRHLVRVYFTQPFFHPDRFPAEPQWFLIGLFFVCAIGLILYLIWLGRVIWKAFHSPISNNTALFL